jgi:DNA replication and repair protein RecF
MLTNFRSYPALDLDCGTASVVLTGHNGAGKTNILEALSMLAPGRGLRGAALGQLSRKAAGDGGDDSPGGPWAVSATIGAAFGTVQLGAGYMPGQDGAIAKRAIRIDGEPAGTAAALAEHLPLVWLTPAHDRLFLDGASDRRRFLDRLIAGFDPRHAALWSAYEKAMRERLGLLRAGGPVDDAWAGALERIMAEHAVALAASRNDGVAALKDELAQTDGANAFPAADIALDGDIERNLETAPAIRIEDEFVRALRLSRDADAEAGRTKLGPHLTDLTVRHRAKGRDARHCSTGEQKSLMIRLVLAGAARAATRQGSPPVLLLDEIAAHLDEARRAALFDAIFRLGAQAWLTGTDARAFEGLARRATLFHVSNASVTPISV